jgi:hypothetical protein
MDFSKLLLQFQYVRCQLLLVVSKACCMLLKLQALRLNSAWKGYSKWDKSGRSGPFVALDLSSQPGNHLENFWYLYSSSFSFFVSSSHPSMA